MAKKKPKQKSQLKKGDKPKDKKKSKVKIKLPKVNLMDFLGLAGINLATIALAQLPDILRKIGSAAKKIPDGGKELAEICDLAATIIEIYVVAMDIYLAIMAALKIIELVAEGISAILNPPKIAQLVGQVAALIANELIKLIPTAIQEATNFVQNTSVEIGSDGSITGINVGDLQPPDAPPLPDLPDVPEQS
jgi:hypothetical protein